MTLIILNFGGQFTHLIARRLRDSGVYAEILPADSSSQLILSYHPTGIILSGGPSSVYEQNAPMCLPEIFQLNIPILGICYGMQITSYLLGGKVVPNEHKEFGKTELKLTKQSTLFEGLDSFQIVWFSHGDSVEKIPEGFEVTSNSPTCPIASMENTNSKIYSVQFHPEVVHTQNGTKILENFALKVCQEKGDWKATEQIPTILAEISNQVKDSQVIMGISGGVDSLVAATLIEKAIGTKLHCVFINTGLLRKNEVEEVSSHLQQRGFSNLHVIDSSKLFLEKLSGVTDPEQKRKIIGHTFVEVFQNTAKELNQHNQIEFLGQGTIYPDRIESAQPTKYASKIKSHHNLTLPEDMKLKVIEPLKEFYKDEVRLLGERLEIPHNLLYRHPFPGPGLAIRILGEIDSQKISILQQADAIFIEVLRDNNYYDSTWQAFAALFPIKSVGVMGDSRTYEYIISLRAVNSVDGMTADWSKIPYDILEKASSRIVNEVRGVNRVVYDITQKPPGTIEYL